MINLMSILVILLSIYIILSSDTGDFVSTMEVKGKKVLCVEPEALTMISEQAMIDIAHLLRPAHLQVWLFNFFLGFL